jgi:hypothetical protein
MGPNTSVKQFVVRLNDLHHHNWSKMRLMQYCIKPSLKSGMKQQFQQIFVTFQVLGKFGEIQTHKHASILPVDRF